MTKSKTAAKWVLTACMVSACCVSAAVAKDGANDLSLRLRIGDDRTDEVSSKFEYRVKGGLARIKGTLKVWVPNGADTGIDVSNAGDALITASFQHDGADSPYAECEFTFDRIENSRIAEFVFAARQTGKVDAPRLRVQKGSCDVDLDAEGLQPGIPSATAGDLITLLLHDEVRIGKGQLLQKK